MHGWGGNFVSAVAQRPSVGCGSPVHPMRGTIVGTHDVSLGGHLMVRVINDVYHEAFTPGVVAPLARGEIRD
jgi:hypothetical protein